MASLTSFRSSRTPLSPRIGCFPRTAEFIPPANEVRKNRPIKSRSAPLGLPFHPALAAAPAVQRHLLELPFLSPLTRRSQSDATKYSISTTCPSIADRRRRIDVHFLSPRSRSTHPFSKRETHFTLSEIHSSNGETQSSNGEIDFTLSEIHSSIGEMQSSNGEIYFTVGEFRSTRHNTASFPGPHGPRPSVRMPLGFETQGGAKRVRPCP